ncbi:hypothetical protein [Gluconobacter cerinus]|uniref:hypothetical protein n=1 Tax=Gluconobacter cerinus TaxID=38307 RepID=UPI0012EEDAA1|nr:hypothetical protein [Gluconobacter cerinus]
MSGPRLLQGRTRPRITRKPAPLARDAPGLTACPVARLGQWQDGLRKTPRRSTLVAVSVLAARAGWV